MWTLEKLQEQLSEDRFKAFFRIHYNLNAPHICRAETLIMYIDDNGSLVYPTTFIPELEENGLIPALDKWMLEKACVIQEKLRESNVDVIQIYVNLSSWTVCNPYDIYDIVMTLDNHRVNHNAINFSFTSTKPYLSMYGLNKGLTYLQQKNRRIMLSHFGSACNTIGMLRDVKFDIIQIDDEFVKKAMTSERNEIMLKDIISMCHELNTTIVLGGVDNLSEFQYAKTLNCEYAIGNYFGRKLTETEFVRMQRNKTR